jgi:hypothetical protein
MIKLIKLTVLLLFMQMGFAEISTSHEEECEQTTSFAYPFFYDDTDSFSYEDTSEDKPKTDSAKNDSPTAQHAKIGKAKVTVDVENTDFLSQCQAKWEKMKKKKEPEKKKRSRFRDDKDEEEKEDHSPRVSASIKWSSED